MSLALIKGSPELVSKYSKTGRRFGSDQTLAQANKTLKSLGTHGKTLAAHGLITRDHKTLTEARDELEAASTGREHTREQRKGLTEEQKTLLTAALSEHTASRTVLDGLFEDLHHIPLPEGADRNAEIAAVTTALKSTKRKPSKPTAIHTNLATLRDTLSRPTLLTLARERTTADLPNQLTRRCEQIRNMQQERATPHGTPEHTAALDFLDGVIVVLCRRAAKAAKVAAKATGNASLIDAFALSLLH